VQLGSPPEKSIGRRAANVPSHRFAASLTVRSICPSRRCAINAKARSRAGGDRPRAQGKAVLAVHPGRTGVGSAECGASASCNISTILRAILRVSFGSRGIGGVDRALRLPRATPPAPAEITTRPRPSNRALTEPTRHFSKVLHGTRRAHEHPLSASDLQTRNRGVSDQAAEPGRLWLAMRGLVRGAGCTARLTRAIWRTCAGISCSTRWALQYRLGQWSREHL